MDENVKTLVEKVKLEIEAINKELLDFASSVYIPFETDDKLTNILTSTNVDSLSSGMTDLLTVHSTIVSEEQKRRDILKYHMMNVNVPDKIDDLNEATTLISKLLELYHNKVGGFNLEDCGWNVHKSNSKIFKVDDNSVVFSNSMKSKLVNDIDSIKYITNLTKCIKRNLSDNFTVTWKKVFDERREVDWVVIIISNGTDDNEESESESDDNEDIP